MNAAFFYTFFLKIVIHDYKAFSKQLLWNLAGQNKVREVKEKSTRCGALSLCFVEDAKTTAVASDVNWNFTNNARRSCVKIDEFLEIRFDCKMFRVGGERMLLGICLQTFVCVFTSMWVFMYALYQGQEQWHCGRKER